MAFIPPLRRGDNPLGEIEIEPFEDKEFGELDMK